MTAEPPAPAPTQPTQPAPTQLAPANPHPRTTGAADRIELRGLRVLGTHGALPEEKQRAQPFEVDVDIVADLSPAGRSDALADTIDYGAAVAAAAGVIAGPHADLLEHLAERVAGEVLAVAGGRAQQVVVTVRKLRPPVPWDLASAAVTVARSRT